MINKDIIIERLRTQAAEIPKLECAHYRDDTREATAYLLSADIKVKEDDFIINAMDFLTFKDYIDPDYRISRIEEAVWTTMNVDYFKSETMRFHFILDQPTIFDLKGIKNGVVITNLWNDKMGYFETTKKRYFYAWDTTG